MLLCVVAQHRRIHLIMIVGLVGQAQEADVPSLPVGLNSQMYLWTESPPNTVLFEPAYAITSWTVQSFNISLVYAKTASPLSMVSVKILKCSDSAGQETASVLCIDDTSIAVVTTDMLKNWTASLLKGLQVFLIIDVKGSGTDYMALTIELVIGDACTLHEHIKDDLTTYCNRRLSTDTKLAVRGPYPNDINTGYTAFMYDSIQVNVDYLQRVAATESVYFQVTRPHLDLEMKIDFSTLTRDRLNPQYVSVPLRLLQNEVLSRIEILDSKKNSLNVRNPNVVAFNLVRTTYQCSSFCLSLFEYDRAIPTLTTESCFSSKRGLADDFQKVCAVSTATTRSVTTPRSTIITTETNTPKSTSATTTTIAVSPTSLAASTPTLPTVSIPTTSATTPTTDEGVTSTTVVQDVLTPPSAVGGTMFLWSGTPAGSVVFPSAYLITSWSVQNYAVYATYLARAWSDSIVQWRLRPCNASGGDKVPEIFCINGLQAIVTSDSFAAWSLVIVHSARVLFDFSVKAEGADALSVRVEVTIADTCKLHELLKVELHTYCRQHLPSDPQLIMPGPYPADYAVHVDGAAYIYRSVRFNVSFLVDDLNLDVFFLRVTRPQLRLEMRVDLRDAALRDHDHSTLMTIPLALSLNELQAHFEILNKNRESVTVTEASAVSFQLERTTYPCSRVCKSFYTYDRAIPIADDTEASCVQSKLKLRNEYEHCVERTVTTTAAATATLTSSVTTDAWTIDPSPGPIKIDNIVTTLENSLRNPSLQSVSTALHAIDKIMDISDDDLSQAEAKFMSSTRLLQLVEDAVANLPVNNEFWSHSKKNFAVGLLNTTTAGSRNEFVIRMRDKSERMFIEFDERSSNETEFALGSIRIPVGANAGLRNELRNALANLVTIAYRHDKLFSSGGGNATKSRERVRGVVLSATFPEFSVRNLSVPVVISFKTDASKKDGLPKCVFWDFVTRDWRGEGCSLVNHEVRSGWTVCSCNHLTNFAVLFGAGQVDEANQRILTALSYIGCTLSFVGAALTLLTFVLFPPLRQTDPPKVHMNLCLAHMLLMLIFLVSLQDIGVGTACKFVAMLVQYALLSVFFWCAVESFHSVRGLVHLRRDPVTNFMAKANVFAWGLPFAFIAVGAGVWWNSYGRKDSCVVYGMPFYVTVLTPVSVVLVVNLFALLRILRQLSTSHLRRLRERKETARVALGFVILYGLTWLVGFLMLGNNLLVFQYLFCIMCSLQGLYMFLFFCLRDRQIQRRWLKLVCGVHLKDPPNRRTTTLRFSGGQDTYAISYCS